MGETLMMKTCIIPPNRRIAQPDEQHMKACGGFGHGFVLAVCAYTHIRITVETHLHVGTVAAGGSLERRHRQRGATGTVDVHLEALGGTAIKPPAHETHVPGVSAFGSMDSTSSSLKKSCTALAQNARCCSRGQVPAHRCDGWLNRYDDAWFQPTVCDLDCISS